MRKSRKFAALLAAVGLGVSLMGIGVHAAFTDQASATENIAVGTFGIKIVASNGNIATDGKSVTLNAPDIQSSQPGNAPLTFTVKNTGSMPATLHVSASPVAAPFSDRLGAVADVVLAAGDTKAYDAGLAWSELSNPDMGASAHITYTIGANG